MGVNIGDLRKELKETPARCQFEVVMTKKERLQIYESFFHKIQMQLVCMNHDRIRDAVNIIGDWSYAHRMGNGQFSAYEQQQVVDNQVLKMKAF